MIEDAKKKAEENSSAFFALANKAMLDAEKAKAEKAATNDKKCAREKGSCKKKCT